MAIDASRFNEGKHDVKTIPEPHKHAALTRKTGTDQAQDSINRHRRITANQVRHLCGDVSDMTLWRWLAAPGSTFPKPIYIGRRRYWREAEVIEWLDQGHHAADGAA